MTNTNKGVDFGAVLAIVAFGLFMSVLLITIGGWLFSIAWNSFMVPVFAVETISTIQGFAALFMAWAIGSAMGFRKTSTPKAV